MDMARIDTNRLRECFAFYLDKLRTGTRSNELRSSSIAIPRLDTYIGPKYNQLYEEYHNDRQAY